MNLDKYSMSVCLIQNNRISTSKLDKTVKTNG